MESIAENLWVKHYELSMLGGHQGRVVTIIRLASGKLIIHSTGPFSGEDVVEIQALGEPGWMVDAMLRHDTFAKDGRAAFPTLPYLVPEGFAPAEELRAGPLLPPPPEWEPEVRVLLIEGMPKVREHVFLHLPTRTLIVADLVFNFEECSGWTSFLRTQVMGVATHPDAARLYPLQIEDRPAYDRSMRKLLEWDFDRIIVGHKEIVETHGKARLKEALSHRDMLPV